MHHLPGAPENRQEREEKRGEKKGEQKKEILFFVGSLKGSHSDNQQERMRIRTEIDRGVDIRRQACAAETV